MSVLNDRQDRTNPTFDAENYINKTHIIRKITYFEKQ